MKWLNQDLHITTHATKLSQIFCRLSTRTR
nr:MAG TPA: hypothetical protein [Caudoviricetes sp.]